MYSFEAIERVCGWKIGPRSRRTPPAARSSYSGPPGRCLGLRSTTLAAETHRRDVATCSLTVAKPPSYENRNNGVAHAWSRDDRRFTLEARQSVLVGRPSRVSVTRFDYEVTRFESDVTRLEGVVTRVERAVTRVESEVL